ncbi:MAG: DUF4123 domain-containing protein [Bacteroidota bacterium]|nr:DUF4123 domain-containing protein [Bacteroidota bacterium]
MSISSTIENIIVFCIVDGSQLGEQLKEARSLSKESTSLYRGVSKEELEEVGPYLCNVNTEFYKWIFENGWGKSDGIFISAQVSFAELYKHFRHFLIVQDEDGNKLYFRFYDPRVLRVFLPTCTTQQLKEFFGPIDMFIVEDSDSKFALLFSLENGLLKKDIVDLTREDKITFPKPEKKSKKKEDDVIV